MRPDAPRKLALPVAVHELLASAQIDVEALGTWQKVITSTLLTCITNSTFRESVSIESVVLLLDTEFIWQKCKKSMLWKQKVWSTLFKGLEQEVKEADKTGHSKEVGHLLLPMCGIIHNISGAIVSTNAASVCTLNVRALGSDCSSSNTKLGTKLRGLATENLCKFGEYLRDKMANHLNAIAPACIAIAQSDPIAKSRRTALDCLSDICDAYPYHQLFPIQKLVLKGLLSVLDDKKRAVRLQAAKVRNSWSTIE